jgi:hypothetical protein
MIIDDDSRTGRVRRERHRNLANALAAIVVLFCFAFYTLLDSAYLMSNYCFAGNDQIVCPVDGPDWIRPVPGYAVLVGLVAGVGGVIFGRPARRPALIAGFVLVTAAFVAGRVLAV